MPELRTAESGSDFYFLERDTPEEIAGTLVKLIQERIPKRLKLNPIRDIQVLCPMNRGSIGVRELNTVLQSALNPVRPGEPAAERFGWRFQVRDKVIQTENDYKKEVFNGDIGTIERIDSVEQAVSIRFDGGVWNTTSPNLTRCHWLTRRPFTRHRVRSSQRWLYRWPCNITCCSSAHEQSGAIPVQGHHFARRFLVLHQLLRPEGDPYRDGHPGVIGCSHLVCRGLRGPE